MDDEYYFICSGKCKMMLPATSEFLHPGQVARVTAGLGRSVSRRNRYECLQCTRASVRSSSHRRRAQIGFAVPQRWRKSESPEHLCYWCGCDLAETVSHIEHLMPIHLGGPAEPHNEVPACQACNLAKSKKHPLVWLAEQF